jgi:hypothetical protein
MAAIIANARAMYGIDSGAEHLAATTKTPTLVIWKADGFHPINYFEPAGNVVHWVKSKGHQDISLNALEYFHSYYQSCEELPDMFPPRNQSSGDESHLHAKS